MKIVVLLTTIIIINECKPNVQRCANFCLEGIAIDYEDSLGMTYKHLNKVEWFIQLINYLFWQIELASSCKELGITCEPGLADDYLDKSSDDLEFSVERLKTTLGDKTESLANGANEQQNDESLKPTAIDVHVG